jgi:hypothetical protein
MFGLISSESKIVGAKVMAPPARAPQEGWHGRRCVLALVVLLGLPLAAQLPAPPRVTHLPDGRQAGPSDSEGPVDARLEAKRIAMLNAIRQKAMVSDADKLLQLALKLQQDADAGETRMSPAERMHTASEIEKLAKGVKEKMTYAIGAPAPSMPFGVLQR